MELREEESFCWRLRMRRRMRKARMQVAAMARKARTTMTAMAQWGKEESVEEACWTLPVGRAVEPGVVVGGCAEREERDAARAEEEEAEAEAAAAAREVEATESRRVVWTAVKMGWGIWLPSRVLSEGMRTQKKGKETLEPGKSAPWGRNQESLTWARTTPARSEGLSREGKWRICCWESARKRKTSTLLNWVSCGRREFPVCVCFT